MEEETIKEVDSRQNYSSPKLTVHGDLVAITLGNDLGEDLDAAFTVSAAPGKGKKKPKKDRFS